MAQGKVSIRREYQGLAVAAVDSSGKVLDVNTGITILGYARMRAHEWAQKYGLPVEEQEGLDMAPSPSAREQWQETVCRMGD